MHTKKISAIIPVSCCQLADAGGPKCDHTSSYKPPRLHPLRVRWARFRKWAAYKVYPDIHEDCEDW